MILWIDAQISPTLATWIDETFEVSAQAVRDLGLLHASDEQDVATARDVGVTVLTKDRGFVRLLDRLGPPPQVLWLTCGNSSNARLREILSRTFEPALQLLREGERLVEIRDALP